MKKSVCKALLSLLCALTLLVGAVPFAAFSVAAVGTDFPWTKQDTLLEQILQRDGLLDGVWYPWINAGQSGHNLTGNEVMARYYGAEWARVELDYYGADKVYREIYNLKAMGFNMMAWGGSIYGEGVIYDEHGDVLGIKQEYLDNTRRLLDMCREIGMPVMWNVYFHCSSAPHYYGMQGWNILCRMLGDRTVADHYAERFVKPLCKVLGEYPDVVALVSIADEPENEINDAEIGNHFNDSIRAMYGVNRDDMVYFMKGINDAVREVLPNMPRTVASNNSNKSIYRDFQLDLMGHNRYDTSANVDPTDDFFTDADMILTEYNIGGDATSLSDELFAERLIKFREGFFEKGYQGGFQWCWIPNATDAAYYMLNSKKTNTDFKETVTLLRHYIDDYRAKHQGKAKPAVDAPVLYANDGTGLVEWIPPRQTTKMTLERSDDGGKTWKKILDNVDSSKYVNGEKKGVYQDTTAPKSGFCYRITVTDGKNTATSAPNNAAGADKAYKQTYQTPVIDYPTATDRVTPIFDKKTEPEKARLTSFGTAQNRPVEDSVNLIKNGSFESTSGAQWNTGAFLKYAKVVSDSTAPEGKKSLYFDTSNVSEGAYYKFTVPVKPNTNYTFSTWVKGDYLGEDNEGHASIGVWDPVLNGFMVYLEFYRDACRGSRLDQQIYPTAWDNEWHLRAVQFNSGSDTEVTIALYGVGSQMWLDGIALYEVTDGIKYVSDKGGDILGYSFYVECATCDPAKSVIKNVRLDDSKSTFWQTGDGWRNGFLSIADNKYEYGKSLKYTASANPIGNYYIKWIDIQPHTEYVFSVSVKILKDGKARFSLIEDGVSMPREMMGLELDSDVYGSDWFQYSITLKSNAFDTMGIGICDLGGSALFDNIRLFKVSDGKEVSDPFKDKNGSTVAPPTATVRPSVNGTTSAPSDTVPGESMTTLPTDVITDPTDSDVADPSQDVQPDPTAPADNGEDGEDVDGKVEKKGDVLLYIGIGVGVLVLIAAALVTIILIRKKKTSDTPEE